jgi:GH24 family phage-related lysozyme (muramidase)
LKTTIRIKNIHGDSSAVADGHEQALFSLLFPNGSGNFRKSRVLKAFFNGRMSEKDALYCT